MRQCFCDVIFELARQLNVFVNSSEFSRTPLRRILPGQCVSSKAHFVEIVVCVSHHS